MEFRWHPIRERDADGRLTAAGLQWTERRDLALNMHIVLSTICLMGAVFGGFLYVGRGEAGDMAATFAGIGVLIAACGRLIPGRTRSLIFHRDGRTTAPHGFAHYRRRYREVQGDNASFISIEARRHHERSDVVMFSRWGSIVYAAGNLHHDEAHCVAVQLTIALAELRESVASDLAGRSATRPRAEAMID